MRSLQLILSRYCAAISLALIIPINFCVNKQIRYSRVYVVCWYYIFRSLTDDKILQFIYRIPRILHDVWLNSFIVCVFQFKFNVILICDLLHNRCYQNFNTCHWTQLIFAFDESETYRTRLYCIWCARLHTFVKWINENILCFAHEKLRWHTDHCLPQNFL